MIERMLLDIIEHSLPESLRPLIFDDYDPSVGLDGVSFKRYDIPSYASNLILFAGLLIQVAWLQQRRSYPEKFENCKIDNLIKQLWVGNLKWNDATSISLIQDATEIDVLRKDNISDSLSSITAWTKILRAYNETIAFDSSVRGKNLKQMFCDLLEALPLLKKCHLDPAKGLYVKDFLIPAFPFLFIKKTSPPLYGFFHSYYESDDIRKISYFFPGSYSTEEIDIKVLLPDEVEPLNALRSSLDLEEIKESVVYLFGNDYAYLRNLAGAITSTLHNETCREVHSYIVDEFSVSLDLESLATAEDRILIMLIKAGPENLLTQTFTSFVSMLTIVMQHYLEYLTVNRGCSEVTEKLELMVKSGKDLARKYSIYSNADKTLKQEIHTRIKVEAAVQCLMSASGLLSSKQANIGKSLSLTESALTALKHKYDRDQTSGVENDLTVQISNIFEDIMRFLICFYDGLYAYYCSCCNCSEMEQIGTHEAQFADAVSITSLSFKESKPSPGTLVQNFRTKISDKKMKKAVKTLLGRESICDVEFFNAITSVIPEHRNDTFHLRGINKNSKFTSFLEHSLQMVAFLKNGISSKNNGCSTTPVYPLVITFQESRICRGGIEINSYSVFSIEHRESAPIKILTPFTYRASGDYYCIPKDGNSSKEFWIEPFIISCDVFDDAYTI